MHAKPKDNKTEHTLPAETSMENICGEREERERRERKAEKGREPENAQTLSWTHGYIIHIRLRIREDSPLPVPQKQPLHELRFAE